MDSVKRMFCQLAMIGFVTLTACVSTKPAKQTPSHEKALHPQPAVTVGSPCYCGWVKPNADAQKVCAVWLKDWPRDDEQTTLAHKTSHTCRIKDCRAFFGSADDACSEYQPWDQAPLITEEVNEPCYCDQVPIAGDRRSQEACAIWKPGDKELKEYHFVPNCDFETCASKTYVHGASYCPQGFQRFY